MLVFARADRAIRKLSEVNLVGQVITPTRFRRAGPGSRSSIRHSWPNSRRHDPVHCCEYHGRGVLVNRSEGVTFSSRTRVIDGRAYKTLHRAWCIRRTRGGQRGVCASDEDLPVPDLLVGRRL